MNSLPTWSWSRLLSCRCGGGRVGRCRQRAPPRWRRWSWGRRRDDPRTPWTRRLYRKPLSASPGPCPVFTTHRSVSEWQEHLPGVNLTVLLDRDEGDDVFDLLNQRPKRQSAQSGCTKFQLQTNARGWKHNFLTIFTWCNICRIT